MNPSLSLHPEVEAALALGDAVVALESTVIAHGLPWPENLALARDLERAVTEGGATPATVAVLGGEIRVGLEDSELVAVARGGRALPKVSRRDLPWALARGGDGATTVAGTLIGAHLAGIKVLATGGIGGVHRGGTADVSADLPELARTPALVVCSGAKAILDLPATLEWFETWGVPVIGYGTDVLPAFWCRESALPLDARVETAAEAAQLARAAWEDGLAAGLLVCVPCPEAAALAPERIESAIVRATGEAEAEGIRGKNLTPYLLRRVAELTDRASVGANLALLRRNAAVAAEIAMALADR